MLYYFYGLGQLSEFNFACAKMESGRAVLALFMNTAISSWQLLLNKLKIPFTTRSTGALYILCPFHREKTPSLRIWPDTGKFFCFGCHCRGSMKDFLKLYYPDLDFSTNIDGIAIQYLRCHPANHPDQKLFAFMY